MEGNLEGHSEKGPKKDYRDESGDCDDRSPMAFNTLLY